MAVSLLNKGEDPAGDFEAVGVPQVIVLPGPSGGPGCPCLGTRNPGPGFEMVSQPQESGGIRDTVSLESLAPTSIFLSHSTPSLLYSLLLAGDSKNLQKSNISFSSKLTN